MLRKRLVIAAACILLVSAALILGFGKKIASGEPKTVNEFEKQYDEGLKNNTEKSDIDIETAIDQLTQAILENDIELVNRIIESKSADINGKDSEGKYPIEMVLVMNNCDMAKILLEAGADPYVITPGGKSVYDIATEEGSKYLKDIFKEYAK